MPSLGQRNGRCHAVFRFAGEWFSRSLKTKDDDNAESSDKNQQRILNAKSPCPHFVPKTRFGSAVASDVRSTQTCSLKEVPKVGLEPTRPCGHWILAPAPKEELHPGTTRHQRSLRTAGRDRLARQSSQIRMLLPLCVRGSQDNWPSAESRTPKVSSLGIDHSFRDNASTR
jgi:hypothetical protein